MAAMKRKLEEKNTQLEQFLSSITHALQMIAANMPKAVSVAPTTINNPLNVITSRATPMEPTKFGLLTGGSTFRLLAGTQPMVKLDTKKEWGARMPHDANCFYLRTGSTTNLDDFKVVVPLKANITIDE